MTRLYLRPTSIFEDFFRLGETSNSRLRTDVLDTGDDYVLNIEVVGYDRDDIKISIEESYLIVSVSARKEEENESEKYLRKEITYTDASRKFYVGEASSEEIKASYQDGILSISIPKVPKASEKKYINIE